MLIESTGPVRLVLIGYKHKDKQLYHDTNTLHTQTVYRQVISNSNQGQYSPRHRRRGVRRDL